MLDAGPFRHSPEQASLAIIAKLSLGPVDEMAVHVVIRDGAPYGIDESTGVGQHRSLKKAAEHRTAATEEGSHRASRSTPMIKRRLMSKEECRIGIGRSAISATEVKDPLLGIPVSDLNRRERRPAPQEHRLGYA